MIDNRDRQILIRLHYPNVEIAKDLDLHPGTVKNRITEIMYQLGVRGRTAAVVKALQLNIISVSDFV